MLDPLGGEELLPARRAVFESPRPLPPAAAGHARPGAAGGAADPPPGRAGGAPADAPARLGEGGQGGRRGPGPRAGAEVRVHPLRPGRRATRWRRPTPGAGSWRPACASRLPLGEPFNPEAFGAFVGDWVHRIVMDGTPLVDVRGSGFDDASGVLRLVVREPVLRTISVLGGSKASEARYLKSTLSGLVGKPLHAVRLRQEIDLAERRLQLMELRYQLKPGPGRDGADLALVPVHHKSQSLALSLGYDTNLGAETGLHLPHRQLRRRRGGRRGRRRPEPAPGPGLPGGARAGGAFLSRHGPGVPGLLHAPAPGRARWSSAAAPSPPARTTAGSSARTWGWAGSSATAAWARARPAWTAAGGKRPPARARAGR